MAGRCAVKAERDETAKSGASSGGKEGGHSDMLPEKCEVLRFQAAEKKGAAEKKRRGLPLSVEIGNTAACHGDVSAAKFQRHAALQEPAVDHTASGNARRICGAPL